MGTAQASRNRQHFTEELSFSKGRQHSVFGAPLRPQDTNAFLEARDAIASVVQQDALTLEDLPLQDFYSRAPNGLRWSQVSKPVAEFWALSGSRGWLDDESLLPESPRLGSDELAAEMAECYAMALLRDVPFESIRNGQERAGDIAIALGCMGWFNPEQDTRDADEHVNLRRNCHTRANGRLSPQVLFRSATQGVGIGPYVSQFLLQGNASTANSSAGGRGPQSVMYHPIVDPMTGSMKPARARDGYITYGAQRIDQRINPQAPGIDYLTDWAEWLDVQNGADTSTEQKFLEGADALRFITTPRHLASFVHYDMASQAYQNCCALLLAVQAGLDPGLPNSGSASRFANALFGEPHILSLMQEVTLRAMLSAQSFKARGAQRARPDVIAALSTLSANGSGVVLGPNQTLVEQHVAKMKCAAAKGFDLLDVVHRANASRSPNFVRGPEFHTSASHLPSIDSANYMLPIAYPEGAPLSPSHVSQHALVAGACVTLLKAVFATHHKDGSLISLAETGDGTLGEVLVPSQEGLQLTPDPMTPRGSLTLQGELNKLASNLAMAGVFAGIHTASECFNSLRAGERIAAALLSEQLAQSKEAVQMQFDDFDATQVSIATSGKGVACLGVSGSSTSCPDLWWTRHTVRACGAA